MIHYVYKLIHEKTGEFYIGSRTCKIDPSLDNYMGSMITWKPDKSLLNKIVLKSFNTRNEANSFEVKLIKKWFSHPLNRNYNIPILDDNGKPLYSFKGKNHTSESRHKMSVNRLGKTYEEIYSRD